MSIAGPILVTGAAGCIGAWIVAGLVQRGENPVVFDLSDGYAAWTIRGR